MFSVVSASQLVIYPWGQPHLIITHDALDLNVQGPLLTLVLALSRHGTWEPKPWPLASDIWWWTWEPSPGPLLVTSGDGH